MTSGVRRARSSIDRSCTPRSSSPDGRSPPRSRSPAGTRWGFACSSGVKPFANDSSSTPACRIWAVDPTNRSVAAIATTQTNDRHRSPPPHLPHHQQPVRPGGPHETRHPVPGTALVQHPTPQARRARPRAQVQGARHAALRDRPVAATSPTCSSAASRCRTTTRHAPHRRLDHLLRLRRRSPVRADGRVHAEHGQRHHQLARQAPRHPDPVPPRHRHAEDRVRPQPPRRAPGDRAGRRGTGRDQAARGHPGHRGDPGARHARSPRRSSRRCTTPSRTC